MQTVSKERLDQIYPSIFQGIKDRKKHIAALDLIPDDLRFISSKENHSPEKILTTTQSFCRNIETIFSKNISPDFSNQFSTPIIIVPDPYADSYFYESENYIGITAGLIALLEFCIGKNIIKSNFLKLTKILGNEKTNESVISELKDNGIWYFAQLDYLIIKYFILPFRFPTISSFSLNYTQSRVNTVLEPVLSFILLHELGHADSYSKPSNCRNRSSRLSEFPIEEKLENSFKI